jgi:putative nucleotidyltransferase with HDIG domain
MLAVAAALAAVLWAVVTLAAVGTFIGDRRESEAEDRWRSRPWLSRALVALAHLIPIASAVATSAVVSSWLPTPQDWGDRIVRWTILLVSSTVVLAGVDRLARRLLPLAALLKLSMLFPDRAPTRMRVARKAGSVRNLQERIDHAKRHGVHGGPAEAAETILTLVGALHAHDRHTRGHSERVRMFTDLVADEMKLPVADRDRLRWASLLHDIGKLHVPTKILNKSGKLDDHEWKVIHRHPIEGATLARPLLDFLGEWAATIEQHHERWDGTGYPRKLRGAQISTGARIVAVADSYEVMTAVRPYKKAMSASAARKELTRCAGTHFDPEIVRAFLNISIGRLRWAIGPVAWVAQVPFIGWFPRLVEGAAAATGQAVGVVGSAAGLAVLSTSGMVPTGHDDPVVTEPPAAEVVVETPASEESTPDAPPAPSSTPAVARPASPVTTTPSAAVQSAEAPTQGELQRNEKAAENAAAKQDEPAVAQTSNGNTLERGKPLDPGATPKSDAEPEKSPAKLAEEKLKN